MNMEKVPSHTPVDRCDEDRRQEIARDKARVGVALSGSETVNRYGSAIAEPIKGYNGIDHETGQKFAKGLRKVAEHKVNIDYADQNIKQQAGFSAEIATTSRDNAEAIISGSKVRTSRTDDLPQYGRNHNVVDRVQILDGQIIEGSQSQMKFVGNRNNLLSDIAKEDGDFARYRGTKLELPTEQYKGVGRQAQEQANKLRIDADRAEKSGQSVEATRLRREASNYEQLVTSAQEHCQEQAKQLRIDAERAEQAGKPDVAARYRREADNYEQLASNVQDSGMTTDQAIFYRKHPKIATALDIARTSHRAGIEGAKFGAAIGGSISLVQNLFALAQEEKNLGEAASDLALDTAKAAAMGYGTTFVGSAIKGGLQQSSRAGLRTLANTNAPVLVVNICLSLGSSVKRYVTGEITESQLLVEVGEKGSGMLSASMMAALGQLAIPIPFIGAAVGGMIGYTLSSMFYQSALDAARGAEASRERLERVRSIEAAARARIAEEQAALDDFLRREIPELEAETRHLFTVVNDSTPNQVDALAGAINRYAGLLGQHLQFQSMAEFDAFMQSDEPLRF